MTDEAPQPKLCIDCKWIATNRDNDWTRYKCFAPQNEMGKSLVSGATLYQFRTCNEAREDLGCRWDARWFEPAPPKAPDKLFNTDNPRPQSQSGVLGKTKATNLLSDLENFLK